MPKVACRKACPSCGENLTIGVTEHRTLVWDGENWVDDGGEDAEHYCLTCNVELEYEELEALGVF